MLETRFLGITIRGGAQNLESIGCWDTGGQTEQRQSLLGCRPLRHAVSLVARMPAAAPCNVIG